MLLMGKKLDGFGTRNGEGFLMRLLQRSRVEEAYDLATVEWAG